MLRSRIIPCLLIHNGGLVKTINFKNPKYVGDPINAVRIFNEKQVDELMVIDIDASVTGSEPNFERIRQMAAECRMPFCYGGGVSTVSQAEKIIALGVEKIAISSAAIRDPALVSKIAKSVGNQSVVVVIDYKKGLFGKAIAYIHNGKQNVKADPISLAKELEDRGAGEIVVNSIDLDGTMKGYDLDLAQKMRDAISIPMTVMGGAGSHADVKQLVKTFGLVGAAAGSLFVFKGKYRAVLINYPTESEKAAIFNNVEL